MRFDMFGTTTKTTVALALLAGLTSCEAMTKTFTRSFSKDEIGLVRVDALVERVERVYVESELAKENVHAMLDALHAATAEDFDGDPHAAYTACMTASNAASTQATSFRQSIDDMEDTAEPFFERWEEDLDTFASAEMRERSRSRLEDTRRQFGEISSAAHPARSGYESFQRRVHDLATFLENDYNPGAVSAIEGDVRALTDHAAQIIALLDTCMESAESYVQGSSLPGELGEEPQAPEAPPAKTSTKASNTTKR